MKNYNKNICFFLHEHATHEEIRDSLSLAHLLAIPIIGVQYVDGVRKWSLLTGLLYLLGNV